MPAARPGGVLVISESQEERSALALLLSENGYYVTGAATAAEAVGLLRAVQFSLVVTDLMLPDCRGADLVNRLRAADPGVATVVVSGYAGCLEQRRLGEMGVSRVLSRPCRALKLLEAAYALTGRLQDMERLETRRSSSAGLWEEL